MESEDRKVYLGRLIMGLEQNIEMLKFQIRYYAPGDTELIYAKKFLASAEDNLAKSKKELAELESKNAPKP